MQLRSIRLKREPNFLNYPFSVPCIKNLDQIIFTKPITLLVGENGSGKSTLIESIAFAAKMISVGSSDIPQDNSLKHLEDLSQNLELIWNIRNHRGFFMRAEDFFGFKKRMINLQQEMIDNEREYEENFSGFAQTLAKSTAISQRKSLEKRYGANPDGASHGESFLNFFVQRFVPEGLYILDEPEIALSFKSQLSFIALLREQIKKGSQFIIATHSPVLMALPENQILEIKNDKIQEVMYDDLESVKLFKSFLNSPKSFLKHL